MMNVGKLSIFVLVLLFSTAPLTFGQPNPQMEQKLTAVKQAAAANQAALRTYKWTESMQVSMGGSQGSPKQFSCQYGPDGKIQKTPLAPQQPPAGLEAGIIEHTIEQFKEYRGKVQDLIHQYVPPNAELLQKAYVAGNVNINTATAGVADMTIKNYLQNGDSMSFSFDENTKKMTKLNINTYMDGPSDMVNVTVQFATLPDGTNYPSQTTINATAKSMTITTTNSDYQKL